MAPAVEVAQTLPAAIGGGVLVSLVGLFIRSMLQGEKAGWQVADARQTDIDALRHEVEELRREVNEQRVAKHEAVNARQAAEMLLATIRGLADACDCGALEKVQEILDRRWPT